MGGAQVITERATPHKRKPANQPPSLQQENVGSEEVSALWSHAFIPWGYVHSFRALGSWENAQTPEKTVSKEAWFPEEA